jgi:ribosomal protein S18 acetylase RimI-like enzyme
MSFRRYTSEDRDACIAILDSNMPRFFSRQDRAEFLTFLDMPNGIYSVLEQRHAVIGCGGISSRDEGSTGILTWGMIHANYHHQGWGRLLAFMRLRQLSMYPSIQKITLSTSQEATGFYEKLGFHTIEFLPNFYGEGLHCCKMELPVDEKFQQRLTTIEAQLRHPPL